MGTGQMLVTAFEPFGGDGRNPSAEVLWAVADCGAFPGLVAEVLPTAFDAAGLRIEQLLDAHRPVAWMGLGLHGGATAIVLERRAANADDADLADNAGAVRRGVPIDPAGPAFRPATLPLDALAAAVVARGLPVRLSDSAGRFVCNHVFYRAAAAAALQRPVIRVGFVHLPWPADWPSAAHGSSAVHAVRFADLRAAVTALVRVVSAGEGG